MTAYGPWATNGYSPQLGNDMTSPEAKPVRAIDWPAIRLDYDKMDLPLHTIAARHGITENILHHRRRVEVWKTRRSRTPGSKMPWRWTATDWAAVRLDYEKGEYSVTEVSTRHGISESHLYRRKGIEHWEPRRAAYPKAFGPGGITANATSRLEALVMNKIAALEAHLGPDEKIDPADPLKGLLTLASAFQKMSDIQTKEKLRDDGKRAGSPAIDDASRDALARRLEALADSWLEAGGPPDN